MADITGSTMPEPVSFLSNHSKLDKATPKDQFRSDIVSGPFQRPLSGAIPQFQFGKAPRPSLDFQWQSQLPSVKSQESGSKVVSTSTRAETADQEISRSSKQPDTLANALRPSDYSKSVEKKTSVQTTRDDSPTSAQQETAASDKPKWVRSDVSQQNPSPSTRSASFRSLVVRPRSNAQRREKPVEKSVSSSSQQRLLEYVSQLQRDLDEAENIIEDSRLSWSKEVSQLKEELEATNVLLRSERKTVLVKDNQLKEYSAEVTSLRSSVKGYSDRLLELQSDSGESKTSLDCMNEQYQELQTRYDELSADRDEVRDALAKASAQQQSLRKQLVQINAEIGVAESINSQRVVDLQRQKDDMASALAEQRDDNMRLRQHMLEPLRMIDSTLKETIKGEITPMLKPFQGLNDLLQNSLTKLQTLEIRDEFERIEAHMSHYVENLICSVSSTKSEICDRLERLPTAVDMHQPLETLSGEQTETVTTKINALFESVKNSFNNQEKRDALVAALEAANAKLSSEKSELEEQVMDILKTHDILISEHAHLEDLLTKEKAKCKLLEFDIERHMFRAVDHSKTLEGLRSLVSRFQIQLECSHQRAQIQEAENFHDFALNSSRKRLGDRESKRNEISTPRRTTEVLVPQFPLLKPSARPHPQESSSKTLNEDFTRRLKFKDMNVAASRTPSISTSSSLLTENPILNDSPLMQI